MSIIERAAQRLAERRRKSMQQGARQAAQTLDKFPGAGTRQPSSPFDDIAAEDPPPA